MYKPSNIKQNLIFFYLLFSVNLKAQSLPNFTEQYIKIWGFLKYYHPEVATGNQDWDSVFMCNIEKAKSFTNKSEANNFFITWIDDLGNIPICKNCNNKIKNPFLDNLTLDWLEDTNIFTTTLIEKLQFIKNNRNQEKNFYVSQNTGVNNTNFSNEKPYNNNPFPSAKMRMLSLARYWNAIEYFFPYKYMTTQKWSEVLPEMIPKFYFAKDTVSYHLSLMELVAKIDDSHGNLFTKQSYLALYGSFCPPFLPKIIDDKAVIYKVLNDSVCEAHDIHVGDVITSIDGKSISEVLMEKGKYIPASNKARKDMLVSNNFLNGNSNKTTLGFNINGEVIIKNIPRFKYGMISFKQQKTKDTFKLINSQIGYANIDMLPYNQVSSMMKLFENTKAIILDLRGYSLGAETKIAQFIKNKNDEFMNVYIPNMKYPGVFTYVQNPRINEKANKFYKGKIVVLVNEITQSQAEFAALIFKTFPNTIIIGSQTSGANGNVSTIYLPGGYETTFSGIGIANPDKSPTQRIGIPIDIIVKQTIKGIKEKRDEVLEKAIEIIDHD